MAREVVWAGTAFSDLESIAEYIARDSAHYAASFVQEVIDASRTLAEFAGRGQRIPEFGEETLRELLIRSYRLIYQIDGQRVLRTTSPSGSRVRPRQGFRTTDRVPC